MEAWQGLTLLFLATWGFVDIVLRLVGVLKRSIERAIDEGTW